jgi:hypothetical protein
MEAAWLGRMRDCRLYAYRLPAGAFRPHEVGGYWVADKPVDAIEQVVIANSTVGFSGSRLRNSAPHPDRFG